MGVGGGCHEETLPALFSRHSEQVPGWEERRTAVWPSRLTQKLIEILSVFCNDVLFVMAVELWPQIKADHESEPTWGGMVEVMHFR